MSHEHRSPRRIDSDEQLRRRLSTTLGSADPIEAMHALTPVQEGMFFESVNSEDADLYLVQQRIQLDGPLDPAVFQQAWTHIVERHAALRTVFVARGGDPPVQVVCRHVPVLVDVVDLTDDVDPEARIALRMAHNRATPFDLAEPPLIRIALFRFGAESHQLLICQPHLLQDGWSAMNVLTELCEAYSAYGKGEVPTLAPVRPVGDFIDWLEAQDQSQREAFWRAQLSGFRAPTRMARGQHAESATIVRRFRTLESDLTLALRKLARRQKVSLSALLTGALAILVGRYTNQSDVVFAIVAAGRPPTLPGVESMVGMLINTLPLRLTIEEDAPLPEWLRGVHATQAALLEHEHSPLSLVQSWSELEAGTQLTDTLVAFGNYPAGQSPDGELKYRVVGGSGGTGFPLSITVEAVDPMEIGLHFDPLAFDVERADQLFESLDTLLRSIVRRPDSSVGDLEIISAGAADRLTSSHDDTRTHFGDDLFPEMFAEQVRLTPGRRAAVFGGEEVTYGELSARVNRLAGYLVTQGASRDKPIGVCLERSLDLLVALLAVQTVGAAFVPLDPALPLGRLKYMVEDAHLGILVTSASATGGGLSPADVVVVSVDSAKADIEGQSSESLGLAVSESDLAYTIYTSGSTGRPKGVAVAHGALANFLRSMQERPGISADDVLLAVTTPSFDISILEFFLPLTVGASVVVADEATVQDGLALAEVIADEGVTILQTTPTRWRLLLSSGWRGSPELTVLSGGEPLPRELADQLLEGNRAVWNLYGPTEATIWASVAKVEVGTASITIGKPIHNSWLHILDQKLRPVPDGVPGTLYIGGKCLAQGYHGRPDLTAERFLPDPFRPDRMIYDTGDTARRTAEGIECLGRSDDQVKIRGYRIELAEIERALNTCSGVAAAAVSVWSPTPGDHVLVAYYVSTTAQAAAEGRALAGQDDLRAGSEGLRTPEEAPRVREDVLRAREEELRAELEAWLPRYMMPQYFVPLEQLPRTANDKLDRGRLPPPTVNAASWTAARLPRNEIEETVVEACAELLGLDAVDLGSRFFDLGGHSLLAMRMVLLLRERTGVRLDPRVLILNTLEHVATSISDQLDPGSGSAVPAGTGEVVGLWREGSEPLERNGVFFGDPSEALFGVHHVPRSTMGSARAILFCPPIGWEYTHSHWASQGLAHLAARQGFHVLRFDYSGTGDSHGRDEQVSVERWISDIHQAAAELRRRSGAERISVVGLRMGAALASLACARGLAVDRLILWDPVVEGAAFLQSQEVLHGGFVSRLRSYAGRAWRTVPDPIDQELLGFTYPDGLRRDIEAIDLRGTDPNRPPTWIVASEDRQEYQDVVRASGDEVHLDVVHDAGRWDDPATRRALVMVSRIPAHILSIASDGA